MLGIGSAGLADHVLLAIDNVMPRTAMPVVVAREVENAGTGEIERHIEVVGKLIKEMTGIGGFISSGAIICAAHVGASAHAQVWPALPHPECVQAHGDHWWCDALMLTGFRVTRLSSIDGALRAVRDHGARVGKRRSEGLGPPAETCHKEGCPAAKGDAPLAPSRTT